AWQNFAMSPDVNEFRSFYASPLGELARRLIGRIIRSRWETCVGLSVMGLGYASPFLDRFRDEALRTLAFMPAEQGVVNWPSSGRSSSTLVEPDMLPLPDAAIDRALVIHALEAAEHPNGLLEEIWRVLTPGGRAIVVAPSRRGFWARGDGTPFGFGQPYSKGQLRDLMRETLFSPIHWDEALYAPPFRRAYFIRSAAAIERVGAATGMPFAGVFIVEATKQLYRPVALRRSLRRALPDFRPALAPSPGAPRVG
ncbi:MAG TPA: methyltransferase domain-containing protein, partial [Roseiarcus sp.]|nr:methyltransferase domain-containing protein [Roseiarcus sp.]